MVKINISQMRLLFLLFLVTASVAPAVQAMTNDEQIAAAKTDKETAVAAVKVIVNRPVQGIPLNTWSMLHVYSPGWYPKNAPTPDFDHVDLHKTQDISYEKYTYVTSDVSPTLMYSGKDVEANKMIQVYYTDPTKPKKRLSEAEMAEVTRLYRIIGKDNAKLADLQSFTTSTLAHIREFFDSSAGVGVQLLLVSLIGFGIYRKWFA